VLEDNRDRQGAS
jgi:hypothetical protein